MTNIGTRIFEQYLGIDYSGAETPIASLKGLRAYSAGRALLPAEVQPLPSPRKYWTRRGIAEWLVDSFSKSPSTLVSIDHAFSFPLWNFVIYHLLLGWQVFLDVFLLHWPTDDDNTYVDFVRDGNQGKGAALSGNSPWKRLTDERAGVKSIFHFDVPGLVAKSTHAGLPWLHYLRRELSDHVHFWPFESWEIPIGRLVVAEIYLSSLAEN